jgi:hypothetical protein
MKPDETRPDETRPAEKKPGERLARLAVSAYPADIRDAREAEMIDTLRDIRATSPGRYPREVADLVRLGLRERAARTADVGTIRLLADGLCVGAILLMMFELANVVSHRLRGLHDPLFAPTLAVALALILCSALVGSDRVAAGGGIVWLIVRTPDLYRDKNSLIGIVPSLVPLLCFVVMAIAPRHPRQPAWWRLGWLVVPAALIAVEGPARPNPTLVALAALVALVVVVTAIVVAATDPRFGIACAVPAAYLGAQIVWKPQAPIALVTIFLAALPVIVTYVIVRTRTLRRIGRV